LLPDKGTLDPVKNPMWLVRERKRKSILGFRTSESDIEIAEEKENITLNKSIQIGKRGATEANFDELAKQIENL